MAHEFLQLILEEYTPDFDSIVMVFDDKETGYHKIACYCKGETDAIGMMSIGQRVLLDEYCGMGKE